MDTSDERIVQGGQDMLYQNKLRDEEIRKMQVEMTKRHEFDLITYQAII